MYLGSYLVEKMRFEAHERATKEVQGERPKSSGSKTVTPPRPFKEMTGREYMEWMNAQGGRF